MVTKVIPLIQVSIHSYIASMKAIRDQVNRDAAPTRGKMREMDPEGYEKDRQSEM